MSKLVKLVCQKMSDSQPLESNRRFNKMIKKSQSGFSLIELLIVLVIIAVIATLAIPGLLRAKRAAENENAYASMRTLVSNQISFYSSNGRYGRLDELNAVNKGGLGVITSAGLVRGNFTFVMTPQTPTDAELKTGFQITATKAAGGDETPYAIDVDERGFLVEPYGNRH